MKKRLLFDCLSKGSTFFGGEGGFQAQTIRLLIVTVERLDLAFPHLVTFSFSLIGTFCQNFNKIDSPGKGVTADDF